MKNIHILPTDKPSRLVKFFTNKFHLCKEILPIHDEEQYQNIYITSDEEIKDSYVINTQTNDIYFENWYSSNPFIKKIILTTDQDLIKYGVQAIGDEFLEWFVKNPSCEVVEVTYGVLKPFQSEDKGYLIHCPDNEVLEEPKQETLEEVAEKVYTTELVMDVDISGDLQSAFINGAKWQQEQDKKMYSEEDMRKMYDFGSIGHFTENESLEQFKNK